MRLRRNFLAAGAAVFAVAATAVVWGCYPAAGEGVDPPALNFYYPVGLAVSKGGNVLYAINSDFDLQWNGGTIQSLDLHLIRRHTVLAIKDPTDMNLPLAAPVDRDASCPAGPPVISYANDAGVVFGWLCAPPTNAAFYMRDSVAIGAFATDLQVSMLSRTFSTCRGATCSRLLAPVRGDASLTWADIADDDPTVAPQQSDTPATYAPFAIDCGIRDAHNRCDRLHHAGNDPGAIGDTRNITMPGEPFGMAQSDDGQALVITHQATQESSLYTTFTVDAPLSTDPSNATPVIQFIAEGMPGGGIGIASVPHDLQALGHDCFLDPTSLACTSQIRPAFLQTSRASAAVALVRFYNDQGPTASTPFRPFIQQEADYQLNVNAGATDFARGIAIDPSPRIRCKANITVPPSDPSFENLARACAQLPARVFIASRGPPSLIIGEVGEPVTLDGSYSPDQVVFKDTVPLPFGPSAVHIAPIIDANGNYALRVFIVCFDSNQIIDYDPEYNTIEAVIRVGLGPFALTFDPFVYEDAANGLPVAVDPRDADLALKKYRFAYVGSFTQSYMQVLDLDNSSVDKSTWATVVYTVGLPTSPKGS